MMMILSFYFHWLSNLAISGTALTGTALAGTSVERLSISAASLPFFKEVKDEKVWSNFEEADPILALYRVERMTFPKGGCLKEVSSLPKKDVGSREGFKAFEPFTTTELASIESCEEFPCQVKLNEKEVAVLKSEPKVGRLKKYEEIIHSRVSASLASKTRGGYERNESALSGWDWLKKKADFKLSLPEKSELRARKLDLAKKGGYQEIRQILEQKTFSSPERFHLWIQDLYTDHYFDSWSEELDFTCQSEEDGTLIQTIVIDLDLLKNTDFFSKIMRPKIRVGVREAAKALLKERRDDWFGSGK